MLVRLSLWAVCASGCYLSFPGAGDGGTSPAVEEVVTEIGLDDAVVSDADAASADGFGEAADDGAGADGEAGCRWSGEYVRTADGACWFARDGAMIEPVVEECCFYRLCNYACGPCYTIEECRALIDDPRWWALRSWCICSTPGPPSPEVDSETCDFMPQFNAYSFTVWVQAPAEPAEPELEEIAAKYCAHAGVLGPHAVVPGVDVVAFYFIDNGGYFAGPCPWQIGAEVGEILTVREVRVDISLPHFDSCCRWIPGCLPTPD